MFTNNKAKYFGDNNVLIEAACLKTDTKPTTGIANGSKCIEMDTGKTYMFNEEDSEWEELQSSGGGGGGTEPLIVTATKDDNNVWTLDKTYNEIKTAVESGRVCVVKGQITVGNSYVFTTYVSYLYLEEGEYFVNVFDIDSSPINLPTSFWATSADGYPMYD